MSNTNLPWISSNIPPDLRQFLERVREQLGGNEYVRRVDYLNRTIPRNPTDPVDPTPPPIPNPPCGSPVTPTTPTGLEVAAGFEAFLLTWDMPGYCGHSHTEVYGLRRDGTSSELGPQHKLGESRGVMYSHVVNQPQDYWCFWIKHVNTLGTAGPFTGEGVCDKTALDPQAVIEVLTGKITETELYQYLGDRIDLIDGPLNLNGSVNNRVAAEALARETGIYNEATARANADGALATQITAVVAKADTNAAAIASEATARANADGALATQITAVVAKADTNAAAIASEATARANADGALATQITAVVAKADTNAAAIASEATARANADGALATQITAVVAKADTNAAAIASEATARANADGALSRSTDLVYARLGNTRPNLCLNGDFEDGLNGMGNGDLFFIAESGWGRFAKLRVATNTSGNALYFPRIPIYPNMTYAISGDAVVYLNAGGTAIAYFDLLFTDATGALLKDGTQSPLAAPFNFSDDPARRDAFAAADTSPTGAAYAIPRFVWGGTNMSYVGVRRVQVVQDGLIDGRYMPPWSQESTSAMVADVATARIGYCTKNSQTTADGTREACQANGGTWNVGLPWATAVKQVAVTYNGQTVALEQQFSAISTDTGNLKAQYSVKIDNNGYVSGFGLSSTPVNGVPYSDFIIRADRFSIGSPANPDAGYQTDPTIPFIVTTTGQNIGGEYVPPGTYIKDGYIQNGTITNAKIKNATIDSAKILTLSADKITGEKMRVGSYIASSSYNGTITGGRITAPGTTGWAIDSAGNAEFDYVHLRKGAVSSMSFGADPGGNTLPMSQLWVATENGAPKTYYKDERVSIREASGDVTTYRCLTTAVQKDPRYTSGYWTRDPNYDFVTLQQITTTGIDVTATTLGAVLFGRFQVYVDATVAPDNKYTGDEGDVVARLVRVDPSTGSLVTITQSGYPLAYCGRCRDPNKPNHYHYSAAIHSFVRRPSTDVDPGTTGSTYYMQARNITHPSTPLTTFSEGLGYIGARR